MAAQEVQMSLSNARTPIHCVTSLPFAWLYYTPSSMGHIHHVRREWKKVPYLRLYTPAHTDTHKDKSVVKGGALQWISALTLVIAFLLRRL